MQMNLGMGNPPRHLFQQMQYSAVACRRMAVVMAMMRMTVEKKIIRSKCWWRKGLIVVL